MGALGDAFDRIDSSGKGYISKDDLKNILGDNYQEDVVDRMLDEAGMSALSLDRQTFAVPMTVNLFHCVTVELWYQASILTIPSSPLYISI